MKIVIIGAGNVGTNLHHALELKGIKADLVHAREFMNGQLDDQAVNNPAVNVIIYTVADNALEDVVAKVHAPKALHIHTSGTMPIDVFGDDKPHAGVLYFFQSFSKSHLIDDWSGIPCFYEGRDIDDVSAIYDGVTISFSKKVKLNVVEFALELAQENSRTILISCIAWRLKYSKIHISRSRRCSPL